jgi:hypothetical protein
MSDQTLSSTTGGGVMGTAPDGALLTAGRPDASNDGKKQDKKPLEERKVYEAGGVIVCGGKVVLRLYLLT